MEVKSAKVPVPKRIKWDEIFKKLERSKSGVLELSHESMAEAKRTYNKLTNKYYSSRAVVSKQGTKVFLQRKVER